MKNKIKIIIGILVPLLLISAFLLGSFFLIKDEYSDYLRKSGAILFSEKKGKEILLEVDVNNFDKTKCEFSYCVVNTCGNYLKLPCDKLEENKYEGEGKYRIKLNFDSYPYNPFTHKFLKSWEISRIPTEESPFERERYIEGIKSILKVYNFRQGYTCALTSKTLSLEEWFCNNENFFSNDYLKTISLAYDLSERLGDEELHSYVQKEIEYLNNNVDKILSEEIEYPEAYILKLVEIGLSSEYLTLIDDFQIPTYEREVLEDHDYKPQLSKEEELFPEFYTSILRYSDYSKLYKEFGKEKLSNYYTNELIIKYNRSPFVLYGLCTVGETISDAEIYKYIRTELSEVIAKKEDNLILNNLTELLSCNLYAEGMNSEITGLNEEIRELVNRSTLEINGIPYIVNSSLIEMEGAEGKEKIQKIIFNYRMLDNLIYVLYE